MKRKGSLTRTSSFSSFFLTTSCAFAFLTGFVTKVQNIKNFSPQASF